MVLPVPANGWQKVTMARLDELVRLPKGWNGYDGEPVRFETAYFTLTILQSVCLGSVPAPQLVPGSGGGDMQAEWHTLDASIELHILGPNQVNAWRCGPSLGEDGEEVNLSTDFTIVSRWLKEMYQVPFAPIAAAG
jgi:hypothetical protein